MLTGLRRKLTYDALLNKIQQRRRGHTGRTPDLAARQVPVEVAQGTPEAQTDFGRAFFAHKGRSITKWLPYLPAYDEQFSRLRDGFPLPDGTTRPLHILEIGVADGGSLQLWREYFGPDAVIAGLDIDPAVVAVDDPDLSVYIGSQTDPDLLRKIVADTGGVDIVLDDGGHFGPHQRISFETLFPLLADGGVYVVEDLHTSYWYDFKGRYGGGASFIEVTKTLIDDMHAWWHEQGDKVGVNAAGQIPRITVYDSVVFISKAQRTRPAVVKFGERIKRD